MLSEVNENTQWIVIEYIQTVDIHTKSELHWSKKIHTWQWFERNILGKIPCVNKKTKWIAVQLAGNQMDYSAAGR